MKMFLSYLLLATMLLQLVVTVDSEAQTTLTNSDSSMEDGSESDKRAGSSWMNNGMFGKRGKWNNGMFGKRAKFPGSNGMFGKRGKLYANGMFGKRKLYANGMFGKRSDQQDNYYQYYQDD